MNIKQLASAVIASTMLALTGCSSQEGPARDAVNNAVAALGTVRADATRLAPAELQATEAEVARLKDNFTSGNHQIVIDSAPAVMSSINTLRSGVAQKQAQSTAAVVEWNSYAAAVPQMVGSLQSRVDSLTKSRRLPAGVDKASFDAVKLDLETMKTEWTKATAAFEGGNPIDAVALARSVRTRGAEMMQLLDVSS